MRTVSYPSPEFPGAPEVAIDVPEGWVPVHTPTATVAARAAVVPDVFTTNVVVNVERRPAGFDLDAAMDELRAMAETGEGDLSDTFGLELAGRSYVGCDVVWPEPRVGRVVQAHLFTIVPAPHEDGLPHLVQVTGSVGGDDAEREYEVIQQVMASVRVLPWRAPRGNEQVDA